MAASVDKPIFEFIKEVKKHDLSDQTKPGIPGCSPKTTAYNGIYLSAGPQEPVGVESSFPQMTEFNYDGPPGTGSNIYYSIAFQIPRWGYNLVKVDEWIEVSPTRADYYQATIASKDALAGSIKQGLASATAAISDYELAKHDLRKYKEILNYFEAVAKAKKNPNKEKRIEAVARAEHTLRAMFVDQVDMHTGEGVSLRSIAPRWSTIISDFMRLTDEDDEVEKIRKRLGVSRAEAVILNTKNQLYFQWKDFFGDAAKERYETLLKLVESRKKSIDEYKEWIKPYIARFKALKVGMERKEVTADLMKSYADVTGQSTYANKIILWAWRPFKTMEPRRHGIAREGKVKQFTLDPYDDFVRHQFILSEKTGLANKDYYPWLKNKISEEEAKKLQIVKEGTIKPEEATVADKMVEKIKEKWLAYSMRLDPNELYYSFMQMTVYRLGIRLQAGEVEDITFTVNSRLLSQNILLVKLLELECRDIELERYIEQMMGTKTADEAIDVEKISGREYPALFGEKPKEEKGDMESFADEIKDFVSSIVEVLTGAGRFELPTWFIKKGHYEKNWKDRISKNYLKPLGQHFGDIINWLKAKSGVE